MEDPPKLLVKLLSERASVPERATSGAAGYDLRASFSCVVPPRGKTQVHTGVSLQIPSGYYGRIAPRSSTAWSNHVDVGAGVIDSDYRGEVVVVLFNHSSQKQFKGEFYFSISTYSF
jgi:dUTP pyrophosphatase